MNEKQEKKCCECRYWKGHGVIGECDTGSWKVRRCDDRPCDSFKPWSG